MLPRSPNIIRILDLVFITQDTDGIVEAVDFEDHGDVALLIWQDLWAALFFEALRAPGAVLIDGSRIPHDLIEAAEAELAAAG